MQKVCQPLVLGAVAPLWHTRLLLSVLLLAPTAWLLSGGNDELGGAATGGQLSGIYLPLLLVNALFTVYVTRLGLGASQLRELFGRPFRGAEPVLSDTLIGLALALAVLGLDAALAIWMGPVESLARHALVPQSASAALWWLLVAASTALSEELLYRGYLRRQLAAMTGRRGAGIALQALLFGVAHGQQGPAATLRAALYGAAFGIVAERRGGLLAVVVCHFALDAYAGLSG